MSSTIVPLGAFTVPTSCSTVRLGTYIATTTTQGSLSSVTQTFTATGISAYGIVDGDDGFITSFDPSCYPSSMSSIWYYYGFRGAYYPGACPDQWTTWSTHSVDGGWIATCCPAGLEILRNYYTVCESYLPVQHTTYVYDTQTPASLVPITTGTVGALPIYIMNYSPPSPGLSTGAKAGIGVGIAVVVLLVAALAFWLYRRRSRQKPAAQDAAPEISELPEGDTGVGINELGPGLVGTDAKKELDGSRIMTETTELEATTVTEHGPAEMDAEPRRAEFDGTGVSVANPGALELHGTAIVKELPPAAADKQAVITS